MWNVDKLAWDNLIAHVNVVCMRFQTKAIGNAKSKSPTHSYI